MSSVVLLGCTGLVGSHILKTLIAAPSITSINTISRRCPPETSSKINAYISPGISQWETHLSTLTPQPQIFISAFGTTRAAAGSFADQYALEHDLHLDLARAAKEAGCRVCVLVSSSSAHDRFPDFAYGRMKRGIEGGVKALGFERTVILRPGVILGKREEARTGEGVAQMVIRGLGAVVPSLGDTLGQDAGVIAEAAVAVGVESLEDGEVEAQARVRVIERSNILEFATQ